jgi:hypothetical protein
VPIPTQPYWFPRKRSGWGWGAPVAWQGWAVIVLYVLSALTGIATIHAHHGALAFIVYLIGLTIAFMAICWMKGEKP